MAGSLASSSETPGWSREEETVSLHGMSEGSLARVTGSLRSGIGTVPEAIMIWQFWQGSLPREGDQPEVGHFAHPLRF